MRLGRLLAVGLAAGAPLAAAAADLPHNNQDWAPAGAMNCQNCHVGHSDSAAAGLLSGTGNENSCNSCHKAPFSTSFGFAWVDTDQATPGVGGRSHRWDALATNFGATPPNPAVPAEREMALRLDGGRLTCSVCHDQHDHDAFKGRPRMGPGDPFRAVATDPANTAQDVPRLIGTQGRVQLTKVGPNAVAAYYKLKATPTQFQISHDDGATWGTARAYTVGTAVALDDPAAEVTFQQAAPAGGAEWDTFYISYPFLRASNVDGAMCLVCHKDRNMRWQDVEGGVANGVAGGVLTSVTLGTTVFHHPVGQALGSNPSLNDRSIPLDADGSVQTDGLPTEKNATNDLILGNGTHPGSRTAGTVTCMTCHEMHNADSNSLTVDP